MKSDIPSTQQIFVNIMLFVINRSNNGSEKNLQEVSKSFSNSQLVFQNVKVGP
jgi:hypothetical protein